jgi:hypothetical protein
MDADQQYSYPIIEYIQPESSKLTAHHSNLTPMHAKILAKKVLPDIPSASGIEYLNNQLYIIGDDSEHLFILNEAAELRDTIALFTAETVVDGRIPKKLKPDFEAMAHIAMHDREYLLILGSGSRRPERDTGYLIPLDNPARFRQFSLTEVYDPLRSMPEVVGGRKLNIEGAAATADTLFLLQRGNITGQNVVICYPLADFFRYLTQDRQPAPDPVITAYRLDLVDGKQPGFSGVTVMPDQRALLVTASLEDTPNEIDDGKVLGSLVGLLPLTNDAPVRPLFVPLMDGAEVFAGKVESIAVQSVSGSRIRALAVTDSDGGESEILWLEIDTVGENGGEEGVGRAGGH